MLRWCVRCTDDVQCVLCFLFTDVCAVACIVCFILPMCGCTSLVYVYMCVCMCGCVGVGGGGDAPGALLFGCVMPLAELRAWSFLSEVAPYVSVSRSTPESELARLKPVTQLCLLSLHCKFTTCRLTSSKFSWLIHF